jgi:peptide subunit release factor RF-3
MVHTCSYSTEVSIIMGISKIDQTSRIPLDFMENHLNKLEDKLGIPNALPIGSMYAIYGNIYHQYTPNVSIYTIHGSYGLGNLQKSHRIRIQAVLSGCSPLTPCIEPQMCLGGFSENSVVLR